MSNTKSPKEVSVMSLPGFTAAVTRSGSSIGTYKAGAGQALGRDICNTGLQPAAVVNRVGGFALILQRVPDLHRTHTLLPPLLHLLLSVSHCHGSPVGAVALVMA